MLLVVLAGCGLQPVLPETAPPVALTPYQTRTPLIIASATAGATLTPVPSPTPFIYIIVRGDTLNGLAQRFNITVDRLLAANPGLVAESLSIGQKLNIPAEGQDFTSGLQATPAPLEIGTAHCTLAQGGLLCLVPLRNPNQLPLENVKVEMTLLSDTGQSLSSQDAILPLNILAPGKVLPAQALFVGQSARSNVQVRLLTADLVPAGDQRYLRADLRNVLVKIAWDGLSASLQGQIFLPQDAQPANRLWLAAVAYDGDQITGYRRWKADKVLQPGDLIDFVMNVYSLGPRIDRVDLQLEAAQGDLVP